MANVSYSVISSGELEKGDHVPDPFRDRVKYINALLQQFKMFKYDNRVKIPAGEELKIDDYFENLEKYNNNYKYRTEIKNLIEFKENKKEFLKILVDENKNKDLSFLTSENKTEDKTFDDTHSSNHNKNYNLPMKPNYSDKVLIFPSFQFFNLKQNDDEEILENILNPTHNFFDKIRISSGYLNLTGFLTESLHKSTSSIDVVTSSPRANSFYKAGFLKKNIPYFYRRYEQLLLKKMKDKNNFSLYEFQREGWSFHSKGFWLYEKGREYPTMTIIGSSNYSKFNLNKIFRLKSFS